MMSDLIKSKNVGEEVPNNHFHFNWQSTIVNVSPVVNIILGNYESLAREIVIQKESVKITKIVEKKV